MLVYLGFRRILNYNLFVKRLKLWFQADFRWPLDLLFTETIQPFPLSFDSSLRDKLHTTTRLCAEMGLKTTQLEASKHRHHQNRVETVAIGCLFLISVALSGTGLALLSDTAYPGPKICLPQHGHLPVDGQKTCALYPTALQNRAVPLATTGQDSLLIHGPFRSKSSTRDSSLKPLFLPSMQTKKDCSEAVDVTSEALRLWGSNEGSRVATEVLESEMGWLWFNT